MRFTHKIQRPKLRPDITPMIDVVFLLLIFFMLSSQFVYNTGIKVKLPKAVTGEVSTNLPLTITITNDAELFLDDKLIEFEDLHKIFKAMKGGELSIVADKETDFGEVIKVWDFARKYNIREIGIRTSA